MVEEVGEDVTETRRKRISEDLKATYLGSSAYYTGRVQLETVRALNGRDSIVTADVGVRKTLLGIFGISEYFQKAAEATAREVIERRMILPPQTSLHVNLHWN